MDAGSVQLDGHAQLLGVRQHNVEVELVFLEEKIQRSWIQHDERNGAGIREKLEGAVFFFGNLIQDHQGVVLLRRFFLELDNEELLHGQKIDYFQVVFRHAGVDQNCGFVVLLP